jgi:hypothetical protein
VIKNAIMMPLKVDFVWLFLLSAVLVSGNLPFVSVRKAQSSASSAPDVALQATSGERFLCAGASLQNSAKTGMVLTALNVTEQTLMAAARNVSGSTPNATVVLSLFGLVLSDPTGEYELVYVTNSSCAVSSHPTCTAALPDPSFLLVGGGAVDLSPPGASLARNVLYESRPSDDLRAWTATGKDHLLAAPARLVAIAVGLRRRDRKPLSWTVRVAHARSQTVANWPTASATIEPGGVLLCGGARSVFGGDGQLLIASAPANASAWVAESKDSAQPDASVIDVYALYAVPLSAPPQPPPEPALTCFADGACVDLSDYDATAADRAQFSSECKRNADWAPFCTVGNVAFITDLFGSTNLADLFAVFAYTAGSFRAQNAFLRATNGAPLPTSSKIVTLLTASGLRVLARNASLAAFQEQVVFRGEPDYEGAPCAYGDGTPAFEAMHSHETLFGWTSTSASANYSLAWDGGSPRLRVHYRRSLVGSFVSRATCAVWQIEVTIPPGRVVKHLACERRLLPQWANNSTSVPVAILYEYDASDGDASAVEESQMLATMRAQVAAPLCFPLWCEQGCVVHGASHPCQCAGRTSSDPNVPTTGVCA